MKRSNWIVCGVLLLSGLFVSIGRSSASTPVTALNLEANGLSSVMVWMTDTMKECGGWTTGSQATPIDSNGWPLTDSSIIVGVGSDAVGGNYSLSFLGQATVSASGGTLSGQSYNSSTNTTTATIALPAYGGLSLSFTNTKRTATSATNTGVTNVKVILPGYPADGSTVINQAAVSIFQHFQAIRFMDFTWTNGNPEVNWSDRCLPTYASERNGRLVYGQPTYEGAWEYAIDLSNACNTDMYICVPTSASTSYVSSLALLIKNGDTVAGVNYPPLNSNLNVYIEYSNEVWNGAFPQFNSNLSAAEAAVNAGGSPLNYDGNPSQYAWAWRRVAQQIATISTIFRNIFGNSAMPGTSTSPRIRPVLMWQYGNDQGTSDAEMSFLFDWYDNIDGNHVSNPEPPSYYLYGAGGATYYTSNNDNASTVDALFASGIPETGYASGTLNVEADWAKSFGLKNIAYEGGWSIGNSSQDTAIQESAHYDPRAAQTLITAETEFQQAGGDLNFLFTSSSPEDDSWAMTYDMSVVTPLYLAVDTLNVTTPATPTNCVTLASTGSTTIQSSANVANDSQIGPAGYPEFGNSQRYNGFLVYSPGGNYQISLSVANTAAGGAMGIWVDGVLAGTASVPNTGSGSTYANTTPIAVSLPAGLHGVLVEATANASSSSPFAGNFGSITFTASGGGSAPSTPTGLSASASNGQVSLSWGASTGAASYNVLRSTVSGSGYAQITNVTTTSYTNTGLTNGTTYYYEVNAVNSYGTSANSSAVSAVPTAGSGGSLIAYQGFNGSPTGWSSFTINSDQSGSATGLTYTGLPTAGNGLNATSSVTGSPSTSSSGVLPSVQQTGEVYISYLINLGTLVTGNTPSTFLWFYNGSTEEFRVGSVPWSSPAYALGVFDAPANTQSWSTTVPSNNTTYLVVMHCDYTNGNIKVYVNPSATGSEPGSASASLTLTAAQMAFNTIYTTMERTTSSTIDEIRVGTTWASVTGQNGAPAAPTNLAATPGNAQVALAWTASTGATSYNIYSGTASGGESATPIATGITGTNYTNTGLTNGTTYYYEAAAVSAGGTSATSNQASAAPFGSSNQIAYQGFNGSPTGWSSFTINADQSASATGLTYTGLPTVGNALDATSSVTGSPSTSSSGVLPSVQQSGEVYISYLINLGTLVTGNTPSTFLWFYNGSTEEFRVGSVPWSSPAYALGVFDAPANTQSWSSTVPANNTTYFLVMHCDYTNGNIKVYVNPSATGSEPGTASASLSLTAAQMAFNTIYTTMERTTVSTIDEIRVGTTWASVTAPSH